MESSHFKISLFISQTLVIHLYNTSNSAAYMCLYTYAYITTDFIRTVARGMRSFHTSEICLS